VENLNPVSCILTNTTGYGPSNISQDPSFVKAYHNTLVTPP